MRRSSPATPIAAVREPPLRPSPRRHNVNQSLDHGRLRELFDRALDLEGPEREAFLDRECAADLQLRRELEDLLVHDGGSLAAALEDAGAAAAAGGAALPQPGARIAGRYAVLREIGRGGMGVVFEAEQLEPRRGVALKCLNPATFGEGLVERFRREGEALARLRHPGIAQVYEAFVVEGEPPQPFLALELVEGLPLDEFAHGLDLRARLALLADVCDALAHAHARGVVHRDLKPANILVEGPSEAPRPKILDFGLARVADARDAEELTRATSLLGTLAYLAPELLEHGSADADPRSDVWSMGVVLYQVLSGRLPLPLEGLSWARATRLVLEREPVRLEEAAPALRGDVATIVHTALARSPARRYADAAALRDDLRRFLAHEPIAAREPSALYRAARFARRHRALVAGFATALLALSAGLVAALAFGLDARDARARAERRAEDLRALVSSLVLELEPELAAVPGATAVRRSFVATGLRFAEGLAAEAGEDADLLGEIAHSYAVLARVQAGPGANHLGDHAGAARSIERALELNERALALRPGHGELERQRIGLWWQRAAALRGLGDLHGAEDAVQRAERVVERLDPADSTPEVRRVRATRSSLEARAKAEVGDLEGARASVEPLLALLREQLAVREDALDRIELSTLLRHRGFWSLQAGELERAQEDFDASVAEAERAWSLESIRTGGSPPILCAGALAEALQGRGVFALERRNDAVRGREDLERARTLLEPLVALDARDLALARVLALVELGLSRAHELEGRLGEALDVIRSFRGGAERRLAAAPGQIEAAREMLTARQIEGRLLNRLERDEECDSVVAEALAQARALVERHPDRALLADDLLVTQSLAADVELKRSERPQLSDAERAERWRAAAGRFRNQLEFVRELDVGGRLAPSRRYLIEKLPVWIERLESAAGR